MAEPTLVSPFIGQQAAQRIRYWQRTERGPAFVRALSASGAAGECANCAGYGAVLISFCKYGPSAQPLTNKKPSTFFPGNGEFGAGWYLIEQTLALACPTCEQQTAGMRAALAGL